MKEWYNSLKKSKITPPNYVFPIVWSILYTLMGIAFYKIYMNKKCVGFCIPLIIFLIQLFFNLIWTTLFFKYRLFKLALLDTGLIIVFTIITIKYFYNISKIAAYLLIPYICWLSLAFYLNLYIVIKN